MNLCMNRSLPTRTVGGVGATARTRRLPGIGLDDADQFALGRAGHGQSPQKELVRMPAFFGGLTTAAPATSRWPGANASKVMLFVQSFPRSDNAHALPGTGCSQPLSAVCLSQAQGQGLAKGLAQSLAQNLEQHQHLRPCACRRVAERPDPPGPGLTPATRRGSACRGRVR